MTHHIVVLPSKRLADLSKISRRDPNSVFMVVQQWNHEKGVSSRTYATAARAGIVLHLPLRLARMIAIFGARPDYIVDKYDLICMLWGDDENGGPDYPMSVISTVVSQQKSALNILDLRLFGQHRGWSMDAIDPVRFLQAAE